MKAARGKMPEYRHGDFFVSPQGCDSWSGKLPEPNASGTDGPFATVERARDAMRLASFRQYRNMYVLIRGGEYRLERPVVFDGRDSHYGSFKIVYAAYPGETPVFHSDVPLTGWRPAGKVPGLPACAAGKVYEADLPRLPGGRRMMYTLYDNGRLLTRAKSRGMEPTGNRLPQGDGLWNAQNMLRADRTHLYYTGDDFRSWDNIGDVELLVMPGVGYVNNYLPLKQVDPENRVLTTAVPAAYVMNPVNSQSRAVDGGTFRVENAIDFVNEPGRWCVDTLREKVYYYPLDGKPGHVTFPALSEYFRMDGHERGEIVRGISLEGLSLTRGERCVVEDTDVTLQHEWDVWNKDNALIRLRDAEDCTVCSCRLFRSASAGVRLDLHCKTNTVENNLIEYVGGTGILLCGYGPGRKDVNGCNQILNNHIHHCGTFFMQSMGILIWQSGENLVRNNLLHHLPYDAVVLSGVRPAYFNVDGHMREMSESIRKEEVPAEYRYHDTRSREDIYSQWLEVSPYYHTRNNLIEENEIFLTMQHLFDGNAIYLSDVGSGNKIHRNYIHHLNGIGMQQGIRTDFAIKDTVVSDNIVYNCNGGGINTKYFENHVVNNIVADIRDIVYRDYTDEVKRMFIGYISLLDVFTRDKMPPNACCRVERNIFYKTYPHQPFFRETVIDGKLTQVHLEEADIDYNLYFDVNAKDQGASRLTYQQSRGIDQNSVVGDPLFEDICHGDFRLKKDSPARKIGFEEIPMQNMGLTVEFPAAYEALVRQELGEDYGDFEVLEKLCLPKDSQELKQEILDNV